MSPDLVAHQLLNSLLVVIDRNSLWLSNISFLLLCVSLGYESTSITCVLEKVIIIRVPEGEEFRSNLWHAIMSISVTLLAGDYFSSCLSLRCS